MNVTPKHWILITLGVALLGGAAGYMLGHRPGATAGTGAAAAEARRVLYWYDPMRPEQHFDRPGKSPFMDMPLVPRYADAPATTTGVAGSSESRAGALAPASALRIDPRVAQNLGVRYAVAQLAPWSEGIDAVGSIVYDQRLVHVLQARAAGFVTGVHARAPGDVVARGAALVDLAVPEWTGAQAEFLALLRGGDPALIEAARARLTLLGMPAELIRHVESSGATQPTVTITAPIAGTIDALDARAGMAVGAGATLVRVIGLASVWLEAAVPEVQARLAVAGAHVEARLAAFPGERFEGRVLAVLPEADAATRTLRLRIELPNPGGRLRPGMSAQLHLQSAPAGERLQVPSEAVIRTGVRDLVLLAAEDGRFTPVQVRLGPEANGRSVVLEGLVAGQRVVASGQFLIDSEASLAGLEARLPSAAPPAPAAPAGAAPASAAPASAPEFEARGKVVEVGEDSVTVAHEAIAGLGWPAMTMPFALARPQLAASLHAGDAIRFRLRQQGEEYLIVQVERAGAAQ